MTSALLPVWILIAPLVLIVADWLLASRTNSMLRRQTDETYLQSSSIVTR